LDQNTHGAQTARIPTGELKRVLGIVNGIYARLAQTARIPTGELKPTIDTDAGTGNKSTNGQNSNRGIETRLSASSRVTKSRTNGQNSNRGIETYAGGAGESRGIWHKRPEFQPGN